VGEWKLAMPVLHMQIAILGMLVEEILLGTINKFVNLKLHREPIVIQTLIAKMTNFVGMLTPFLYRET